MSQTELHILPRSYPINNSIELPAFLYWKNLLEKFLTENFICCDMSQTKKLHSRQMFSQKKNTKLQVVL